MKFKNASEMYNYLLHKGDLYSETLGQYVFDYNDAHALCVYHMTKEEMQNAIDRAISQGETMVSAVLGVGGTIFDNPEYDHFRYSEKEEERNLYLKSSLEYCVCSFNADDWMDVSELFTLAHIEEVEELNNNTPDGQVVDALLSKKLQIHQHYLFVGMAQRIFDIWKESTDKKAVEDMFYELTNASFEDFLKECKENIEVTGFDYILSANASEQYQLSRHLSMNGYKTYLDKSGLLFVPEEEKYEVETILEDRLISYCMRGPIRQLDITKEDVRCCDELTVENGTISATYELWFEADKYFGWETRYHDGVWINFYTDWHPDGTVTASYNVDGDDFSFHEDWKLTEEEQEFFRNKMENYCKETNGQTLLELWAEMFCMFEIGAVLEPIVVNETILTPSIVKYIYNFLVKNGVDMMNENRADISTRVIKEKESEFLSGLRTEITKAQVKFEEKAEMPNETSLYFLAPEDYIKKFVAKEYEDIEETGIRIDFPKGTIEAELGAVSISPVRHDPEEDIWESYDWTDIYFTDEEIKVFLSIAKEALAQNDPEHGNCTTCEHYSKCNICSDCHEGSNYEYLIH